MFCSFSKRNNVHISCSLCAAGLGSSTQCQCECAAHVGTLQSKPEQLAEPEHHTNNTSPPADQLQESQPGVPLHRERPPVDQSGNRVGVSPCWIKEFMPDPSSWVHWQAEGGKSHFCSGDGQLAPGGRSVETSGTFTRLIVDQKWLIAVLLLF